MTVQLFKSTGKFTNQEGKEVNFTNFFLKCGESLIPIQVKNFSTSEKPDKNYSGRKAVLSAFAEKLADEDNA